MGRIRNAYDRLKRTVSSYTGSRIETNYHTATIIPAGTKFTDGTALFADTSMTYIEDFATGLKTVVTPSSYVGKKFY